MIYMYMKEGKMNKYEIYGAEIFNTIDSEKNHLEGKV